MKAEALSQLLDVILDDLSARFIINLPEEELSSVTRICFGLEQAHWFYEDFFRPQYPALPSVNLRAFTAALFSHCPLLWKFSGQHEAAFDDFLKYKIRVPVRGAIMLNKEMDKVGGPTLLGRTYILTQQVCPRKGLEILGRVGLS